MGFLLDAARGEDTGPAEAAQTEEMYERLFAKMARDFVCRRDYELVIQSLIQLVDEAGTSGIDYANDSEARALALEYRDVLNSGRDGSRIYTDLIDLDED